MALFGCGVGIGVIFGFWAFLAFDNWLSEWPA